jgi:hypothetical protein
MVLPNKSHVAPVRPPSNSLWRNMKLKYLSNMDSTIFHFLRLISNRIANKHKQPNKITIISLSWMNHKYPNGIMDEKR